MGAAGKMELYNLFKGRRFCTIREIFADFAWGNNGEIIGLWLYKGIHGSYSMVKDPDRGEGPQPSAGTADFRSPWAEPFSVRPGREIPNRV